MTRADALLLRGFTPEVAQGMKRLQANPKLWFSVKRLLMRDRTGPCDFRVSIHPPDVIAITYRYMDGEEKQVVQHDADLVTKLLMERKNVQVNQ